MKKPETTYFLLPAGDSLVVVCTESGPFMGQIPGYKLIDKIGEGGMSTVYKAVQESLSRPVAIKVLSKKLADNTHVRERFNRESFIIARLSHPNIIHVIDRGFTAGGMPFFVMEYVTGTDLSQIVTDTGFDFNRKLDLVIQICKALAYAHKNAVIHRDIKPANVLIDTEGNARMLDFGIAQFYGDDDDDIERTRPGVLMGTLPYMSPEQQTSSDSVTVLSDIYSLGVLIYELFTGNKPAGRFPRPCAIAPSIPPALDELIMSCLEQEPEKRPASADVIKDRLLTLLQGAHLETAQRERAGRGIQTTENKFALLDVIKEGPYGAVYLYQDRHTQSLLVIKKRPSQSSGFMEAKLLTSLRHKNIVDILGTSRNEQLFILVMEYVSGGSLKDRLVQPHPWKKCLVTAREICQGLSFAHKNRIVHGDLRPSNILFTETGQVKITDFGLDEHYADRQAGVNWYNPRDEAPAVQTDIFAAGSVFYHMLTGSPPRWREAELIPHDHLARLPEPLQALLRDMLDPNPTKRPGSFDQVAAAISALLGDYAPTIADEDTTKIADRHPDTVAPPPRPKTRSFRPALTVLLLLLGLCGFFAAYLAYTGTTRQYLDALRNLAANLSNTITPLLEKLANRLGLG